LLVSLQEKKGSLNPMLCLSWFCQLLELYFLLDLELVFRRGLLPNWYVLQVSLQRKWQGMQLMSWQIILNMTAVLMNICRIRWIYHWSNDAHIKINEGQTDQRATNSITKIGNSIKWIIHRKRNHLNVKMDNPFQTTIILSSNSIYWPCFHTKMDNLLDKLSIFWGRGVPGGSNFLLPLPHLFGFLHFTLFQLQNIMQCYVIFLYFPTSHCLFSHLPYTFILYSPRFLLPYPLPHLYCNKNHWKQVITWKLEHDFEQLREGLSPVLPFPPPLCHATLASCDRERGARTG